MNIDTAAFFAALADEMNAHPEQFRVLGECDMSTALVMRSPAGDFAVAITFEGLRCEGVAAIPPGDADHADYFLDGPLSAWQSMFDDILANGAASGRQTINSLALLGTDIRVRGTDPMGTDKFSRFNQTLQEYLDGAARMAAVAR
ncbi:MAG: hypothetical protein F2681_02345 [Actinobacteria bacterium]|uniref:Unannotated protein n=1 Tax=freshwater metagenome TaxID=449393 RepID=A0A6J6A319_9ZZZZ|nr:hypothetical protein [Actinomycetota bacterium]MSW76254.1 hypothetical protein [Actinomycetota bacterium]MSX92162.1 hypothetical protein [Actinomycetota bacterium]MSZ81964.1 hypothetical protein [Actinomycetota bacterium]MTB16803.1 hypothetical protein [Actinomycetota bacterium]